MDKKKAKHTQILSGKREQILKRNIELTSDGDDDMDIKKEVSKRHADELESVLNEIGVGGIERKASSKRHAQVSEETEKKSEQKDNRKDLYEEDVDDIDDDDDYLEEDGVFDLFAFARKKRQEKHHSEAKIKSRKKDDTIQERKQEKAYDASDESVIPDEPDNTTISASESDTAEILNQEELEELEASIESGKYDTVSEEDAPNAGIYEEFGGYSKEEDFEEEEEADEESDGAKFFREQILDEKMPEPKSIPSNIKWGIAFGLFLVTFIVLTICYIVNLKKLNGKGIDINQINKEDLLVNDGVEEHVRGYKTIVLYGVDSREGNTGKGSNSDSIILVSINEETKEVRLVSIYRDTLLDIQGDGAGTHKINYAYQLGGALESVNTLNKNLDLYITDYITVDFGALSDIIDALGGIEIDIADNEIDNLNKNLAEQIRISGVFSEGIYEKGKHTLNGQQAVAYTRIRSTDSGDIARTERQRKVLLQIADKIMNLDISSIGALVDISFDCISTSITKETALSLAEDISQYKIVAETGFPFAYNGINLNNKGNVLVAADLESNVAALHEFLYAGADYKMSDDVLKISSEIKSETGIAANKVVLPDGGNKASEKKTPDDIKTITEPPEGMLINE